ncbi:MAG: hypothetical protein MI976_15355 [Pseudomonadales bacterium]|nr:hypothetical protein [Pseudomonadales bacterium]
MGSPAIRSALLLCFIAFLSGCVKVTISSPIDGGYYSAEVPENFTINFSNGQPEVLTIELNNIDVTEHFVIASTGATAPGEVLREFMIPGNNFLRAAAGSSFDQARFYYDIEGPEIHVTEVVEGADIVVTGTAVDRGGINWVRLNGVEVNFLAPAYDKGSRRDFTVTIANDRFVQVESEDNHGNYSNRAFARRDVVFSPGVSARLNNSGIEFLAAEISEFLKGIDIASELPYIDFRILGSGIRARATNFGWRGDFNTDIQVVNDNEQFDISVDVHDVIVGLDIDFIFLGAVLPDFGIPDGRLTIDRVHLDTLAMLSIENGNIDVALDHTNMNLTRLFLDANIIPGILEHLAAPLINGVYELFEGLFIPIFIGFVESAIVPIASDFIGTIPLDFAFTLNGETVQFLAIPETIDTLEGGVNVEVGVHMEAETLNKPALGSPAVIEQAPELEATTPNGRDFHIAAVLSGNFLNQALLAAHETGITTITIDVIDNAGLSYDGLQIIKGADDEVEPGDTFRIIFDPASPPVIDLGDTGGAMGRLILNNARFAFDVRKQGASEYRRVFGAELDVSAFFNLGVQDNGNLDIGIVGLPTIKVLDIDNTGFIRLSEGFTNTLIQYLVPIVVPPVAKALRSVPLPEIAGYGLRPEQIWSPEPLKTHLAFAGSLVKNEDTALAPNPDTVVELIGNVVTWVFNNTEINILNGTVTVNIDGVNPNESIGSLQYRFRLDDGDWSEWAERDRITLERLLGGAHTLEVCSRSALLKEDPDCAVQTFETARAETD